MKRRKKSKHISTIGSRLTSSVSICLVLILLSATALTVVAARRLQADLRRNVSVVVHMERDCPASSVNSLKQRLLASAAVETFSYSSAEEILAQESELMGEDIAALAEGNPYTSEFELHLRPAYVVSDSIEALCSALQGLEGVAAVDSETAVLEGLDTAMRRAASLLGILAAIVLVVAIGLINNTVSLAIYSRRFIIYTMKLVGATPGYICRPFVWAGLRDGLIAGAVCAALVGLAWHRGVATYLYIEQIFSSTDIIVVAAGNVVVGGLLYSVAAWTAARRYIRADYDQMFMK